MPNTRISCFATETVLWSFGLHPFAYSEQRPSYIKISLIWSKEKNQALNTCQNK